MSRGVRDLRELICVSRLSAVDSDPEDQIDTTDSEDQNEEYLDRSLFGLSLDCDDVTGAVLPGSNRDARQSRVSPQRSLPNLGEKRGGAPQIRRLPHRAAVTANRKSSPGKSRNETGLSKSKSCALETSVDSPLRKSNRLMPGTSSDARVLNGEHRGHIPEASNRCEAGSLGDASSSAPASDRLSAPGSIPITHPLATRGSRNVLQPYADRNYDALLRCVEPDVVAVWLEQANTSIAKLDAWCHAGENFVRLAQHWLGEVSQGSRTEVVQLEHKLLVVQLSIAFQSSLMAGRLDQGNLTAFLGAIFRQGFLRVFWEF